MTANDQTQTFSKITDNNTDAHRIVIVGGGAGGLELATTLGNKLGKNGGASIVLVDHTSVHIWKPLLHEVAAGSMDAHKHQLEYAAQARWHHFVFQQGALESLNRERKTITVAAVVDTDGFELLPQREIQYDTLVLAIGSVTNFFKVPGAEEHAIAVDTLSQAEHFRRRMIAACMRTDRQLDQREGEHTPRPKLNIAIIGGGATGVELSAELRNTAEVLGAYGLHQLDPRRDIHITLIEAAPRILSALTEQVSIKTEALLRKLHIEVLANEKVSEIQPHKVVMASGKVLVSDLTVWTAGIQAPPVLAQLGLAVNYLGQINVAQTLLTETDPNIFAFGDCAGCPWPQKKNGKDENQNDTVPPRAQAAHQQAVFMFDALTRRLEGKPLQNFIYRDLGSLVSLGRFDAVGNLMGPLVGSTLFIEGFLARMLYVSLYRRHLVALHGVFRTVSDTLGQWLQRKTAPRVKLH